MKNLLRLTCYVAILLIFTNCEPNNNGILPTPTNGKTIVNEKGEADGNAKEKWMEQLHSSAPDVDWRNIEAANRFAKSTENKNAANCNSIDDYANGQLSGKWHERGSYNQSGSIGPTVYDAENEMIYAISAGGTLWKGSINGNAWEPVRDDLVFDWTSFLRFEYNGGYRMIALMNKVPFYSDNEGLTWSQSMGMNTYDNWGNRKRGVVLDDANKTIYMLIQEWDPDNWGSDINLYRSTDQGVSYSVVHNFGNIDINKVDLSKTHNGNDVYVVEKGAQIKTFKINVSGNLEEINSDIIPNFNTFGNLTSIRNNFVNVLYLSSKDEVYRSVNDGASWTLRGNLPTEPWSVGVQVSPFNANHLYYGDIECYQSTDGGQNWTLVNSWADYYGDPAQLLHADMMHFSFFTKADGTEFIAIGNHGGLNLSFDNMSTTPSIAQGGLNVSQYYSVRTDDDGYIYGGSQDQGFQRTANGFGLLSFDQVISGDYGHIEFSKGFDHLWTVYPGGWVTYYHDPQNGGLTASYDLESNTEAAWIPPLMASPNNENAIYLAGGNISGQSGSHIIKLVYNGNSIDVTQKPFDFLNNSGGTIASIAVSPLNSSNWFVATSNGMFYHSDDGGNNFTNTTQFDGPEQHYLYGSTIYASKLNSNTVYLGGSGYSNPAVYKSTDGGVSFSPMVSGLPSTLVFEIVANADETILFAATEAGPYAYVIADDMWYDLSDGCAPAQTYWSVEFVENQNTVRYGTYGRGIWDFKIEATPLDVELLAFTARKNEDDHVELNWKVTDVSIISNFEIERSHDGIQFELLNKVQTNDAQVTFNALDRLPYVGTSYYRLKVNEDSNKHSFSNTIPVTIYENSEIDIYPNPVAYHQPLQFKCGGVQPFQFRLFDEMGKLVLDKTLSCNNNIQTSSLPSGTYFYKIMNQEKIQSGKLLIL